MSTASKLSSCPLKVIASLLASPGTLCWFFGEGYADISIEFICGTEFIVAKAWLELFYETDETPSIFVGPLATLTRFPSSYF